MIISKSIIRYIAPSAIKSISSCKFSTKTIDIKQEKESTGKYDIIIAGGGMVGCTLACSLGKNAITSNLKILLLEGSKQQKFEFKPDFSNRVVALNQNTKTLMNSLKVWRHVEEMRLQPVREMQVWDACSDASISFSSSDILDDDIAYIVENDALLHAINKELISKEVKNVSIVYGAKIAGYDLAKPKTDLYGNVEQESFVKMDNGDIYSCQLLIGADGANSAVRKAMGVQYLSWSYDQMGVVATLKLAEECENNTAWQRFLPSGPVALLPLDSTHSSLVWSTSQEQAKQLLQIPDEQFVDALNDALWKQYSSSGAVGECMDWTSGWLKRVGLTPAAPRRLPPSVSGVRAGSRAAFPLAFGHSTRYVAPGVALIGDAAHRVHPLAGQGVNLGFGDVTHLTEYLADALYMGLDVAHDSWLEKYESSRQRHNVPTQLAIDALHRLYSVQLPPLVLARSVGLQITNALQPLKKLIMTHATS